jgi:hypothetical protein
MRLPTLGYIAIISMISGCTVVPIKYNMTTSRMEKPTRITSSIKGLQPGNFSYDPPSDLGQFQISNLGCIPCKNSGATPGIAFEQPIHEIVKREFTNSLAEAVLSTQSAPCMVNGTIHMAGHDVMNGDQVLDITYTVSENAVVKYKKRIKVTSSSPLFGGLTFDRLFQKAAQKSVEELLADNDFRVVLSKSCQQ